MQKKQIINIINFIRGVEPREQTDLVKPVKEQIALMEKLNLKGTFLIQYDALCNPEFTNLLRVLNPAQFELGIWFEVVQPLAEKTGIAWKGRYSWDWHAHCGFSVGYTRNEREKLIDCCFQDFKDIFGYYPKSFGSWAFDAHTLAYANDQYGLDAACNCKDQWGTDGYTLWGGYYGQGYYPSRMNAFCPAQNSQNQINTPIFRMLGSDPIYQYDLGLEKNLTGGADVQGVVTLEPVYTGKSGGGGIPTWVDWYMKENFNGNCVTFGYAQAGQENSFGWESMRNGLIYQFELFARLADEGQLEVETLGNTGRWYKNTFPETPPSAITALNDWKDSGRRSIWYNCKNYRINLYAENQKFWIRDLYLFRENYEERYLDNVCLTNDLTYDNLPVVDGNRFSGNGIRSGFYPCEEDSSSAEGLAYTDIDYHEDGDSAVVTLKGTRFGDVIFHLSETGIIIEKNSDTALSFAYLYNSGASGLPGIQIKSDQEIQFTYRDYSYGIQLEGGTIRQNILSMTGDKLQISFL